MNDEGVCRTAPATPGPLKILKGNYLRNTSRETCKYVECYLWLFKGWFRNS